MCKWTSTCLPTCVHAREPLPVESSARLCHLKSCRASQSELAHYRLLKAGGDEHHHSLWPRQPTTYLSSPRVVRDVFFLFTFHCLPSPANSSPPPERAPALPATRPIQPCPTSNNKHDGTSDGERPGPGGCAMADPRRAEARPPGSPGPQKGSAQAGSPYAMRPGQIYVELIKDSSQKCRPPLGRRDEGCGYRWQRRHFI